MWPARRLLKYSLFAGASAGTLASLNANQYDVDAIGIVRLGRAAATVFNIAFIYKTTLYAKDVDYSSEEYAELKSKVHKEAAEKLLDLCCTNKGVYIKVGQHIGALDYLVPKEYVETMKILHSHAPCSKLEEVYQVLKEDLKQDPHTVFTSFEPEPLGAASLAQVHKAKLQDGTTVAVKVQHPYVKGNSLVDMKTMEVLVKLVSWAFPDFKFDWLVEETKRNIPKELDFTQEGENAEKISQIFQDCKWLKIPSIHWNLTTNRVLTMEFLEGGQINDLEYIRSHRINPYDVSQKLGCLYSQMIFIHGFVHSDPHPGNILVRKSPSGEVEIVLLDHGLYATLSNEIRWEYSKLWLSILNFDRAGMRAHCEKLGVGDLYGLFSCMVTGRTWDAIESGIDKVRYSSREKEMFQKEIPGLLPQISDVLARVNRQILLILKTNDLMRGIEHTLKTESRMASFLVMSKCCIQSVYGERQKQCTTRFSRWQTSLSEKWALFKLQVYYTYLTVRSFPFFNRIKSLMMYRI
ncbi:aarF domain-containing kinase 1 isoform X1 [Anabrus simplex]|uniref:aarF domain-containing kinase 1 isoform X1 n=1 Tax=Anabrus simplex TaxID=316456 RepID=UPI0034DCEAF5